MKYCAKCDTTKPYTDFGKSKWSLKDGYAYTCKACIKEYQLANKEKLKAYQKEYQPQYKAEHKDKLNEYNRVYHKEIYRDKHLAYVTKWRAANPDKVAQYRAISDARAKAKKQMNDQ